MDGAGRNKQGTVVKQSGSKGDIPSAGIRATNTSAKARGGDPKFKNTYSKEGTRAWVELVLFSHF